VEIDETKFFYEDESFVFQSVVFDNQSKSMVIEKRDITKRKGKYRTKINFREMRLSKISLFHQVTDDSIHNSIGGIEAQNSRVKERFNEFEQDFIATPEFSILLAKTVPSTTTAKMKVSSTLLACSRTLVDNNINKRMQLVAQTWEISQNLVSFENKANDLLEHLEASLENDHHFYEEVLSHFFNYVVKTWKLKIRQEKLPSPKRTKKVTACWKKKFDNLDLIIESCKQTILEKEVLFTSLIQIDLAGSNNKVQDPILILKSLSITNETFH
jgi:hypothetical protein